MVQLVARPAAGEASNASRTAGVAKLFTLRRIFLYSFPSLATIDPA
jgi:hypothetical protein